MPEFRLTRQRVDIKRFPKLDLSRDSDVSNYVRICDLVSKMIAEKRLADGEILPGENIFASYFKTSRATVRRAFRHLEEDGFLVKRQGKGTVVSYSSFSDQMLIQWCYNLAYRNCTRTITGIQLRTESEQSGEFLSGKLNIDIGTQITVGYLSFFCADELVANCVVMVPNRFLDSSLPTPRTLDELLAFFLNGIYSFVRTTETSIQALSAKGEKDRRIPVLDENVVLNVQEFLYDSDCDPIALYNYYLRNDCYRLPLNRKSKAYSERG